MPQFSKGECERSQQLIYRKLFISYRKSKEKEREGRWRRRGVARRRHKCTKRSLPPACREQRKRKNTGRWSGDGNIQFNNGILKKIVVVFKL